MFSKTERAFLLENISVNSRYARMLRWRIRNKVQGMQADLQLAQNSHVNLTRRPEKRPPERSIERKVVLPVFRKKKPIHEFYEWPARY